MAESDQNPKNIGKTKKIKKNLGKPKKTRKTIFRESWQGPPPKESRNMYIYIYIDCFFVFSIFFWFSKVFAGFSKVFLVSAGFFNVFWFS